jgi:hypothetical protein
MDGPRVRRVSVLDAASYARLFDHVVSWPVDRSRGVAKGEEDETISTLIHTFFQFAQEQDQGQVQRVKFSSLSGAKTSTKHSRSRSRTGPVLSGARKQVRSEEMYLQCLRGQRVLIVAFVQYAPNEDNSQAVVDFLSAVNAAQQNLEQGQQQQFEKSVDLLIKSHFGASYLQEEQEQQEETRAQPVISEAHAKVEIS